MQTRRLLAAAFVVATLLGCGTVADQLNAPLTSLTDLAALDQLNQARPGDPALVMAAYDGLSLFNAHLLGSMPLEATLRIEDAIAAAVISASDWSPPAPTPAPVPAADVVVAGL